MDVEESMKKLVSPKKGPSVIGDIVALRAGERVELEYAHDDAHFFTATHHEPGTDDYFGELKNGRRALAKIICGSVIHLYIEEEVKVDHGDPRDHYVD
jgi:hypothetical protein